MKPEYGRTIAFVAGAVAAVAAALDMALEAGVQVRPVHLIAIGGTALATYAMKWFSDVTAADAKEIEARARRESIMPPAAKDMRGWDALIGDAEIKEREP